MEEMTKERFCELVAAYGANIENWPKSESSAAIEFCVLHNRFCNTQLEQAKKLDDLLVYAPRQKANKSLHSKILATFPSAQIVDGFSLSRLAEMLFGDMQQIRGFALAGVFSLVILGGLGGYVGSNWVFLPEGETAMLDKAFMDNSFNLDLEAGA